MKDTKPTKQADMLTPAHGHEEHMVRVNKVKELEKLGMSAWPENKAVSATCQQVVTEYAQKEGSEYSVAGRIMTIRLHGKTAFLTIQDMSGKLQLYIAQDSIGLDAFDQFKRYFDAGDFVWVRGTSFTTKTGQISIKVDELALLSKSLYPLPEKFHGLVDVETRYRQRYLDLISNPESRERFIKRSRIVNALRHYLDAHDFLEVETPMLHPLAGGAAARPFITHHNALGDDFYLRIAPELYLKRLVVGGFERVYEINRNFRNEGVSTRHNPEFTMLEMYWAYQDYHFIMDFIEKMMKAVALQAIGTAEIPYGSFVLDFGKPFARLTVAQAVMQYGGYTADQIIPEKIDALLAKHGVSGVASTTYGGKLFALFEAVAERNIIQPTFVIDFPIEVSPLAKRDPARPEVAARFELFVAGMELSNGFNELNDPFDQAGRFEQQVAARHAGDAEAHQFDGDYILALEHALPPTVGVGIGIDRLVMLFTDTPSIRDVILFPTLKKK